MDAYLELEQRLAEWSGMPYVVACSSGTAALHLALEALELPPGSEVIVPEFTMVACARAVVLAGLKPVFVDCGDNLLLDQIALNAPRFVEANAVMPVHIYGRRCNMDKLSRYALLQSWKIIEDLAEAHGVKPHPDTDAACWSFYRNKIVAGEEGGAVAFRNSKHAELARSLRSLGDTEAHDFMHRPRGHNYRMSNAHARLIIDSLLHYGLNQEARKRAEVAAWYDELIPLAWRMPPREANWVYDLRIPGMDLELQTQLVSGLRANGVEARHAFKPMRLQPEFNQSGSTAGMGFCPVAWMASQEVIYLPIRPEMTQRDVESNVGVLLREAANLGLVDASASVAI